LLRLKTNRLRIPLMAATVIGVIACTSKDQMATDFLPTEIEWEIKHFPDSDEFQATADVDAGGLVSAEQRLRASLGRHDFLECDSAGAASELFISRSQNLIVLIRGRRSDSSMDGKAPRPTVLAAKHIGTAKDDENLLQMCPELRERMQSTGR